MQSKISVYYRLEQCKVTARKVTLPLLLQRMFNVSIMKSTFNHPEFGLQYVIMDQISIILSMHTISLDRYPSTELQGVRLTPVLQTKLCFCQYH